MKQILNIDNVESKCSDNGALKWQDLLFAFEKRNLMINTISNQISKKFDLL